jgi:uncharacterized cupredoxin-like copper-binding protein
MNKHHAHSHRPAGARRAGRHLVVLAVVLLAAAACSRSTPPGQQVRVSLRDFHIGTSATTVPGGTVTFDVSSRGPTTHEFVVVRTDLSASALPIGPDGITVDEESPRLAHVGEASDVDIGGAIALTLQLGPGHYVLFCNLEGHYLAGMHTSLTVD